MKRMMKRLTAAVLVAVMGITSLPVNTVSAASTGRSITVRQKGSLTRRVLYIGGPSEFKSLTLQAKVKPKKSSQKVKYASSSKKIATVSRKGKVVAKKKGKVTITITTAKKLFAKKKIKLTVKKYVYPTSVSLTVGQSTLRKGESTVVSATVKPKLKAVRKVTFTSSDTALAVVSSSGRVTANTAGRTGTVTITATAAEKSKKKKVIKGTIAIRIVNADSGSASTGEGGSSSGKSEEKNSSESGDIEKTDNLQIGNSKAFEESPIEGVTISAEENALDHDRDFKMEQMDETLFEKVNKPFEENNGAILKAWRLDAGMEEGQLMPGHFDMSYDLRTLGIPEELWEDVRAWHVDKEGKLAEYACSLEGSVLTHKSRENFGIVLGIVVGLPTLYLAIAAGKSIMDNGADLLYKYTSYDDPKKRFSINWPNDLLIEFGDESAKTYIEDQEKIDNYAKQLFEECKERIDYAKYAATYSFSKVAAMQEWSKAVGEEFKKELKTNEEYLRLTKERRYPRPIAKMITQIEAVFDYLASVGVRMPTHKVDYDLLDNLGADSQAHVHMNYWKLASDVSCRVDELYTGDPATGSEKRVLDETKLEAMIFTLTHETFHVCQNEYIVGESIPFLQGPISSVKLFEASAAVIECNCLDYYRERNLLPTLGSMSIEELRKLGYVLADRTLSHFDVPLNQEIKDSQSGVGYVFAYFLEWLRENKRKITMAQLMENYHQNGKISETISSAYGFSTYESLAHAWRRFGRERGTKLAKEMLDDSLWKATWPAFHYNYMQQWNVKVTPEHPALSADYTAQGDLSTGGMYMRMGIFQTDDTRKHAVLIAKKPDDRDTFDLVFMRKYPVGKGNSVSVKICSEYDHSISGVQLYPVDDEGAMEYVAEVMGYNPQSGKPKCGYRLFHLCAPEAPVVKSEDGKLVVTLPKAPDDFGMLEKYPDTGVFDGIGILLTLIRDDGAEFTEELPMTDYGKDVKLDLSKYSSGKNATFKAKIREFAKKGSQRIYGPESVIRDMSILAGTYKGTGQYYQYRETVNDEGVRIPTWKENGPARNDSQDIRYSLGKLQCRGFNAANYDPGTDTYTERVDGTGKDYLGNSTYSLYTWKFTVDGDKITLSMKQEKWPIGGEEPTEKYEFEGTK